MPPRPGGSNVPLANTTSTSGHGAAAADGKGPASSAPVVTAAIPSTRVSWRGLTLSTLTHVAGRAPPNRLTVGPCPLHENGGAPGTPPFSTSLDPTTGS